MRKVLVYIFMAMLLSSCGSRQHTAAPVRPDFCSDSAFAHIAAQMAMGPRVPNSEAHTLCARYISETLQRYGAEVHLQAGMMPNYAGQPQRLLNIIAHFGPLDRPAILLCAHYDTRPWTDAEVEYDDRHYCVPGANDGASGVAVLLEVARQLQNHPEAAVTMVFFDVEDMGTPRFYTGVQREETWCLGSQYFALSVDPKAYTYGVVLDMVGAPDAYFAREYYSEQFASNYVEQIWRRAAELGHSRYFHSEPSFPVTDDHLYLCRAGIPTVDIVHFNPNTTQGFPATWHTRQDNLDNISLPTLQAVGEVVMSLCY